MRSTSLFISGNPRWMFAALCVTLLLSFSPTDAKAAEFQLIYNGNFNTQEALNLASQASPTYFTSDTPFTLTALFDTNSPNLAPPSPPAPPPFAGFRAYAPSVATMTISGVSYSVETFTTNPTAGIVIATFDRNTFVPNRYGIGFFQQPIEDGAGIVGDFLGASPDFTGTVTSSTVFTGFQGVGHSSGVCLQGAPPNCALNAVTPLILRDSANNIYNLTLGNYSADFPVTYAPGNILGPNNSAVLTATPEPSTYALAALSLILFIGFARRFSIP